MFQLTRPRGARRLGYTRPSCHRRFNSRAREGRDARAGAFIYAAAGFNSRAREGRDSISATSQPLKPPFQLTRPRGARRDDIPRRRKLILFQLTRPRGARRRRSINPKSRSKFQLTRPRGARPWLAPCCAGPVQFQLTRPRGARLTFYHGQITSQHVSTHAPARGATSP